MLRLLTDLNLVNRFDAEAPANLMLSGVAVTGTWVAKSGDGLVLPSAGSVGVFQVWTESNRDGSAGWSPDASAGGKSRLTLLYGKYRALTDQFAGSISVGDALKVDAAGKLVAATLGDGNDIAVCTKASHTITHLGATHTVIEFVTR